MEAVAAVVPGENTDVGEAIVVLVLSVATLFAAAVAGSLPPPCRSTCPSPRPGSTRSRMRRLSSLTSGDMSVLAGGAAGGLSSVKNMDEGGIGWERGKGSDGRTCYSLSLGRMPDAANLIFLPWVSS